VLLTPPAEGQALGVLLLQAAVEGSLVVPRMGITVLRLFVQAKFNKLGFLNMHMLPWGRTLPQLARNGVKPLGRHHRQCRQKK